MSGIFALESYWSDSLTDSATVRGLLDVLGGVRGYRTAHRMVHSDEALLDCLEVWSGRRMRSFGTCYLAFHGEPGVLYAGRDGVGLEQIAESLEGRLKGRRLHLAACSVGDVDEEALEEFRRVTKAQWVSAYTTDVEWIPSAALDLVLLNWLADETRSPAQIRRGVDRTCGSLAAELGLVTVARSGVVTLGAAA